MVEGKSKGIGFGAEFVCCFEHWTGEFSCGPAMEICHLAGEVLAVSCVVDIPDLLLNLGKERLAAFLGAVFDLEKGVEETLKHDDGFEERLPRLLGWRPTIRVDGLGRIVWINTLDFVFEMAVSRSQCYFIGGKC